MKNISDFFGVSLVGACWPQMRCVHDTRSKGIIQAGGATQCSFNVLEYL